MLLYVVLRIKELNADWKVSGYVNVCCVQGGPGELSGYILRCHHGHGKYLGTPFDSRCFPNLNNVSQSYHIRLLPGTAQVMFGVCFVSQKRSDLRPC